MLTPSLLVDSYRGRRVLVTGASGFIGRWVARFLSAAEAEVLLVTRRAGDLAAACGVYEIRGQRVEADLGRIRAFADLYEASHPDVVFNLVGYGVDPSEREENAAWALNARLVEEIAEAVASDSNSDWPGIRFIHVGTAAEYGPVDGPVTDEANTSPVSLYGRTKLAGTRSLSEARRRTGVRAITARLFSVYGPGEHAGRLLPSLIAAARTGGTLPLTAGMQKRDFTFVGDVAEGLLRLGLLTGETPDGVNLATGNQTAVRAFVECAAEVLGLNPSRLQFGALPGHADEVHQGAVDTRKLRALLGWIPETAPREGIAQTVRFEARWSAVRS